MKLVIPTISTRGNAQPYIALALGLQDVGHTVTVATHPAMRGLVKSYGVLFAPIGPDIDIAHETAVIRGRSTHWMIGFLRVMKLSFAMLKKSHPLHPFAPSVSAIIMMFMGPFYLVWFPMLARDLFRLGRSASKE